MVRARSWVGASPKISPILVPNRDSRALFERAWGNQRDLDTRLLSAVPIHAQDEFTVAHPIGRGGCDVEPPDDAGSRDFGQRFRFARGDINPIAVTARPIVRRNARGPRALQKEQIVQRCSRAGLLSLSRNAGGPQPESAPTTLAPGQDSACSDTISWPAHRPCVPDQNISLSPS
jgi:hypothetical protein